MCRQKKICCYHLLSFAGRILTWVSINTDPTTTLLTLVYDLYKTWFKLFLFFFTYLEVISVVNAAWLTGLVKPWEIWALNFWLWILQAEKKLCKNLVIHKKFTPLHSVYAGRFLSSFYPHVKAHSCFASTYHFLAFPILIFYMIAFHI